MSKSVKAAIFVLFVVTLTFAVRFYQSEATRGIRTATYPLLKVNAEVTFIQAKPTELERRQKIRTFSYRIHNWGQKPIFPKLHFTKGRTECSVVNGKQRRDAISEGTVFIIGDWLRDKTLMVVFKDRDHSVGQKVDNPIPQSISLALPYVSGEGNPTTYNSLEEALSIFDIATYVEKDLQWNNRCRIYLDFGTIS